MAFKMNIPLPGGIEHANGYVRVTDCRVCKKDDADEWFMMVDVAVYKDNPVPINQIAEELNTDYIVEGSVRIIDDNLRVSATLINILEDKTVWSNSYNNKLTDIFTVQDEIAEKIVAQLDKKLTIVSPVPIATSKILALDILSLMVLMIY